MTRKDEVLALRELQQQIDKMREDLGIGAPGAVLYMADLDALSDKTVVVEADGFGGATTMVVEGNYPLDYFAETETTFASERQAVKAADRIVADRISRDLVSEE